MTRIALFAATGFGVSMALGLASCADRGHDATAAPARAVLYYRDPMHPSYTSPKPGKAPDCGMDLEPVYADEKAPAGALRVGPEQQKLIGLSVDRATGTRTTGTVRTSGRVAVDENRIYPVRTGCDGWVTRIFPAVETGSSVRRGQPLASVYGRDFTTAQLSYIYALRAAANPPPAGPGEDVNQPVITLEDARRLLGNFGMGEEQIAQLTRTRQAILDINLTAPADGVIVSRSVSPQQRFERDAELFRIADLRRVWIIAELLGDDQTAVRPGDAARVTPPGDGGSPLVARVSAALPEYDPGSRTAKVRLESQNPGLRLRPAMVVDLEFTISLPETTTVPAEAVIETGHGAAVYVASGDGAFEERAIETGWRFGGRVQVVHGLNVGESIVVSGNALLDAESRLRQGGAGVHD